MQRLVLLFLLVGLLWPSTGRSQGPTPPGPTGLPRLLTIEWKEGPEYPLGIQDSVMGILHDNLVSAGGFTRHPHDVVARHPDAFGGETSGFTRIGFALPLAPLGTEWRRIADLPGPPRQGAAMAVVGNELYTFGGFSYTAPWTHRDVCRLRRRNGQWAWETLPYPLPWPLCESGVAVLGRKIYLAGGADYYTAPGAAAQDFHSEQGREGQPIGRALLMLDTENLARGWQRLPDRPGVGTFDCGVAAVRGRIYVMGGVFAPAGSRKPQYYNAVDAWSYDPRTQNWSRLADLPDGSNRRGIGVLDRYVLLVAGYKYRYTWRVDGTRRDIYTAEERARDWRKFFEKTVLVYDTRTRRLGTADPLLDATSWPMLAASENRIYSLGGEGGARLWHPATLQIGTVVGPVREQPGPGGP